MRKDIFLEIYKKLTDETKEKMDEKISEIEEKEQLIADLNEALKKLSSKEKEELLEDYRDFLDESLAEQKEISKIKDEFSYVNEMEDFQSRQREVLMNNYPSNAIDMLIEEIDSIECELFKLIPDC